MSRTKLMWIVIIAAALITISAIWAVSPAAAEEAVTMYCVCQDSRVNVRAKPSTKASVEGYLEFGWDCRVTGSARDSSGTVWYRVEGTTELGYGYVCASYLITSEPTRVDRQAKISADGRVAVYNRVDGRRKAWAKVGEDVQVRVYSDTWCLTDRGWIRTEYLRFSDE